MAADQNGGGNRQDPIDERLLDDQQQGDQAILDAAQQSFEEDQRSPEHPTRTKRESGVFDPSHAPASTREGPGHHDYDR